MKTRLRGDQRGIAAFLITFFIMTILGLVVMGFAQLTRRDLRQSLDRQLGVQAQYAAETGMNDAIEYLKTNPTATKTDCSDQAAGQLLSGYDNVLDTAGNVSYTCILIDSSPGDFKKQDVGFNSNVVLPVQPVAGNVNTITVEWTSKNPASTASGCPSAFSYPATRSASCRIGLMRVDLVPYGTGASPSRNGLIDGLYTLFAHPVTSGGGSANYVTNAGSNPEAADASCAGNTCTMTINTSGAGTNRFYMRLNSIYAVSDVTIRVNGGGGGNNDLVGAQAVIDVTGRAADVIKRIQVRAQLNGPEDVPGFALQTQNSQCKRYGIIPPNQAYAITPTDDCGF